MTLRARHFDAEYYADHKAAGLDYLGHGDWQEGYGRWVVGALGLAGKDVLDVGCACGSICLGLRKAGARVCGVDLNNTMIHLGRGRFPDLALAVCDAVNLHLLDDASQDCYHSNQVAEHWRPDHVPLILAEAYRVLRPGGLFFCVLDTEEMFARQGRDAAAEDPTNRCVRPLGWWQVRLAEAGFAPADRSARALAAHPDSYLKRYDWDWLVWKKPAG